MPLSQSSFVSLFARFPCLPLLPPLVFMLPSIAPTQSFLCYFHPSSFPISLHRLVLFPFSPPFPSPDLVRLVTLYSSYYHGHHSCPTYSCPILIPSPLIAACPFFFFFFFFTFTARPLDALTKPPELSLSRTMCGGECQERLYQPSSMLPRP